MGHQKSAETRPVERRGRAIGALFNRRVLDPESNLCYGEGGAGTWSDGKLTTRIGRNSENVRKVSSLNTAGTSSPIPGRPLFVHGGFAAAVTL